MKPLSTTHAHRLGEVLELMRLLWALDHDLQSLSKQMGRRLGITAPQRLVIRIIGRYPGLSAKELADILCLHPSTLTGVLQRLEHRRIIHRKRSQDDGRRAVLTLTAQGRKFDVVRSGTVEAAVRRMLTKTTAPQIASTRQVLSLLTDELR